MERKLTFLIVGLIIWGISVDKNYNCGVGQVAFFLCMYLNGRSSVVLPANAALLVMLGVQTGNTAITSYIVDCYPLQSMSIITFYSVILDLSAFINPVSKERLPRDPSVKSNNRC